MKQKSAFLLSLLVAVIIYVPAAVFASTEGDSGTNTISPELDTPLKIRIDSLLASFPQDGPGGVVAVVDNGELIYTGSYGYAQVEWSIPNSMDASYRIGSVTKTFTALAVLQLAERGKLSLDDKAAKWFPDVPFDGRITLAHLLSHTSGLIWGTSEPEFVPGEKMNYSNYGYILLGQLIEKASGSNFEQYLKENIFLPLGMHQSGYDHNRNIIPRRAAGYEKLAGVTVNTAEIDMDGAGGAGGLYSSPADMVRFAQSLKGHPALPASLINESIKPFTLNSGEPGPYGFGWMTRSHRGWREVAHGGDIDGFNCFFSHYPEVGRTVIVIQNMKMQMNADWSNGSRLSHHVLDIIWGSELESDPLFVATFNMSDEKLQRLTGTYAFENAPGEMIAAMGASIDIFVENGKLMVRDKTGKTMLEAVSESEFVLPGIDIRIKFHAGTGLHPSGLNLVMLSVRDLYARRVE